MAKPISTSKPKKKGFSEAGINRVMQTMIKSNHPMRFHEIVKSNFDFGNTNGLLKAARELVKQGKLNCTRDKDGNIYTLNTAQNKHKAEEASYGQEE